MDVVLDWYCEAYRCKMTKKACDLRRKRAMSGVNGPYGSERLRFTEAGCHTCTQYETREVNPVMEEKISVSPEIQECRKCHEVKPITEYFKSKGKPEKTCKKCRYEQEKVWKISKGIITGKAKEDYRTRIGDEPTKECKTCQEILPLRAFFPSKTNADGREGRCRKCKHENRKNVGTNSKTPTYDGIIQDTFIISTSRGKDTGGLPITQTVLIDFSEYPDLYHKLADISKREFRPMGMQALYMIQQGI